MILQVAARPVLSRQAVKPQALFGFGKKDAAADKAAAPQYYICEYLPVIQLISYGSNGFNTAICSGIANQSHLLCTGFITACCTVLTSATADSYGSKGL